MVAALYLFPFLYLISPTARNSNLPKWAIFSTNSPISCDARIFYEGTEQRINKPKGVRNYIRRRWVTSIYAIIPSSEFEAKPLG